MGGEQGQEEGCEVQGLPLIATGSVGQQQGCGWGAERKGASLNKAAVWAPTRRVLLSVLLGARDW